MPDLSVSVPTADAMRALAADIARVLEPGDIVVLGGDLGAGKTCFVQGAAAALGVTEPVGSPSFVLVREYRGRMRILHADVYRLNAISELEDLGYDELFAPDVVTFVEWGDAVAGALPAERLEVEIVREDAGETRHVTMHARGERWERRLLLVSAERA